MPKERSVDLTRIHAAFSSRYHEIIFWEARECPKFLSHALTLNLPHLPNNDWEDRFAWGGVFVNGKDTREDLPLVAPCRIEYYEPLYDFKNPGSFFPAFSKDWIIFEDQDLVVCYKPNRLPTIPAREQTRFNLRCYLESYYKTPVHMPSRIDMSTQGLVIASKAERMHNKLQNLFVHHTIQKEYLFLGSGAVNWSEIICNGQIGKDPRHPVLRKVVDQAGKPAVTKFTVLHTSLHGAQSDQAQPTTLVLAQPLTGRTHQIRVHTAYLDLPIVGDNFYGGYVAESLHLLSYRLAFTHPFTQERLNIRVPHKLLPTWAESLQ